MIMYRGKTVFCLCVLVFMLSACGTATLSTTSVATPEPTVQKSTPTMVPSPTKAVATPVVSNPTHLLIPSIGVDAPVENIGVLANGDLATPTQNPWEGVG